VIHCQWIADSSAVELSLTVDSVSVWGHDRFNRPSVRDTPPVLFSHSHSPAEARTAVQLCTCGTMGISSSTYRHDNKETQP